MNISLGQALAFSTRIAPRNFKGATRWGPLESELLFSLSIAKMTLILPLLGQFRARWGPLQMKQPG